MLQIDRVLKIFRTGFLGKSSPVHFFWGSFDLAVTRFSGRPAPRHPGGILNLPDRVTREAGEFILPYDAVRTADDPDGTLLDFLASTYEAAATTANWDRNASECVVGKPRLVRRV